MNNNFRTTLVMAALLMAAGNAEAEPRGLAALDINHDGMISRAEAAANPMLARQFDAIDTNHDGQLSREEIAAYRNQMRARFAERFHRADTNHDGALSREEAAAMPMVARQFDQLDANHDGRVTMEEIQAFRRAHHE